MFDPQTAQQVLGAGDTYDTIDIKLAEGADPATVQAAIEEILPPRTEVVTGEQVAEEAADDINSIISIFGNGLLAFAFITDVRERVHHQQRVRHHDQPAPA